MLFEKTASGSEHRFLIQKLAKNPSKFSEKSIKHHSYGRLGRSWGRLGGVLVHLGGVLGRLVDDLGRLGGVLEPSGPRFGSKKPPNINLI